MKRQASFESDLNFEATELRLGLPRRDEESEKQSKRPSSTLPPAAEESRSGSNSTVSDVGDSELQNHPPAKAQVVGWPPVRSYRKNAITESGKKKKKKEMTKELGSGMYVKVSMDGAPYLRKIDLNLYQSYHQLLDVLEKMFNFKLGIYSEREGYNGCDYVPTYEDKDGDWMLVGDVPWDMFTANCKRLRMMKGSDARGLGCL